jgi:long-chain acyl-CoA synthetase
MNKNFNNVEQVKKFELLSSPFSLDKGEITPGLGKLRRKVIMERRAEEVRKIYL